MQKLQLFIVFLLCSMVMVILQNGLNQTWDLSKLSKFVLPPKTVNNINEIESVNNLAVIKHFLSNETNKIKIFLNTENYDVLKRLEEEVRSAASRRRRKKLKSGSRLSSYHKLASIEMLLKMMSTRDHLRNSPRLLNKLNRRAFFQAFDPLVSFPIINATKTHPIRYVLLVSHFRAGSSFVGDLLQQNWKTFYSFEPLHLHQINYKIQPEQEPSALSLLSHIYSCSFTEEPEYVNWIRKPENKFLLTWNRFLWSLCNIHRSWCYDPLFLNQLCLRTKYRVIKATRLSLKSTEKLLQSLPGSIDLKVVYLVRDPRAVHNSRSKLKWCSTETLCGDYNSICDDYESDLEVYSRMVQTYRDKIIALRHEDLSLDPYHNGEKLFTSLGLPFTASVRRFLRINTEAELPANRTINPYSIRRSSKKVISRWTRDLNETTIDAIQSKCSNVLQQLGYKLLDLSSQPVTENGSPMEIPYESILQENLPLPNAL